MSAPSQAHQNESFWGEGFDFVIQGTRGWVPLRLRELWKYRELLLFFCWRDIKVRYKQTVLGAAWAVIQPVFTMVVFSFFFGRLAKVPSDGLPYPIFAYAALVPWTFFATVLAQTSDSMVNNAHLIKKIYFPRLVMPLASVLVALIDFVIALLVLFGMMIWFRIVPGPTIVLILPLLFLTVTTALGAGLWLSALNVQYRDVKYTMSFLLQFWLLATPIAYPSSLLGEPWRTVYGINPMAGVVEGFRYALLNAPAPGSIIWVSALVSLTLFVSGTLYFRRMERTFADVL